MERLKKIVEMGECMGLEKEELRAWLLLLNADSPTKLVSIANNAGDTALHMACRFPGRELERLVRLLVHHGAPRGALNKAGMRPVDLLPPDLHSEVGLLLDI
ncbi:hypothetical protein MTO96_004674 [Rhipicephalus appendiculatus]